jgi:hypothetical protein
VGRFFDINHADHKHDTNSLAQLQDKREYLLDAMGEERGSGSQNWAKRNSGAPGYTIAARAKLRGEAETR